MNANSKQNSVDKLQATSKSILVYPKGAFLVLFSMHRKSFKRSAHCACVVSRISNRSDFRDNCESEFSKDHCVGIRRLRGPCSAKRSLEMEEETNWSQILCSKQRSYIKIENLRGKNPTEIHNALREVCGNSVVDRSTVSRWGSLFHEDRVIIQEDPRSGRPVTTTDDTSAVIVRILLAENRRK
jgi:hypothetical protein